MLPPGWRGRTGGQDDDGQRGSIGEAVYNRLGGVYSIATVLEELIDRVLVDPRLNANSRVDEAHQKLPRRVQVSTDRKCCAGPPLGCGAQRCSM